ncbi:fibroblast growth factor receptor 4-like isoform X2 [Acropora muricata]|uniref:fibroblast growth factor receptor 4-like isoform X2 n=1 Tax=Acropora muricata TaxID=159855 RepID=UPI0034E615EA
MCSPTAKQNDAAMAFQLNVCPVRGSRSKICRVMLFYIVPLLCVFHFKLRSADGCRRATNDTYQPTVELKIIEFPNENILPIGYNVTIACISNASNAYESNYHWPFWIQFYRNHISRALHDCGGRNPNLDGQVSKVCELFIQNATKEDSANYTCWALTLRQCVFRTTELQFREPKKPIFTIDLPSEIRTITGNKDTLTCQASGTPPPVITWFKNGRPLISSSVKGTKASSTLAFHPVSLSDQGNYWCEARNFLGSKKTSTVAVSVFMKPIFKIHPKNVSVSLNDGNITLECSAEGSPKPVIIWLKNNSTMVSETSNTQNGTMSFLTIIIHKSMKIQNYRCIANNSLGNAVSQEATVSFLEEEKTTDQTDVRVVSSHSWSFLWPTVSIAVAVLLLLLVILAFFKHKQWKKRNYLLTNEIVRHRELIELKMINEMDLITQLRLNQSSISSTNSSQEGTVTTSDEQETIDNEQYLQIMDTNNRNWEIPRHRIIITQEKLGGGQFGVVKKGIYSRSDGHKLPVAVKQLKENANQQERMSLIFELETLIHVGRHPNIVSLVGACTFEEPICVVIEFVSGGSLDKVLKASHVPNQNAYTAYTNIWSRLTERELLSIALDVTTGMKHLESRLCVHRDLASRNVLIGNGLVAKVADFGMARDVSTDGHYIKATEGRIPWLWMSIEALKGVNTIKGDVWSFGVVLWEIVTLGELPYRAVRGLLELHDLLQDGVRLEKPRHCSQELYDIMLSCWEKCPDDRPTFEELFQILQEILNKNERAYINVTFFEE